MYRRPKSLDSRITDELYEKLMDIASAESEARSATCPDISAVLAAAVARCPKEESDAQKADSIDLVALAAGNPAGRDVGQHQARPQAEIAAV